MGVFQFDTGDGRTFEVEAPDAQTAYSAFQQGTSQSAASGLKDQARLGDSGPAENRVEQGFAVAGAQSERPELQAALGQASQARQTGGARGQGGFMETADAGLRGAADALTFGTADEITAGLGTGFGLLGDYGKELQRQRSIDAYDAEHSPWARMGGQVAGSVAGGLGATVAAPNLSRAAMGIGKGWGQKIARTAATGAVAGGAQGFGSGEGLQDRISQAETSALIGGGVGAASVPIGAAVGGIAGRIMNKAPAAAPTADALAEASRANYTASKEAGVFVKPESIKSLGDDLAAKLAEDGLDPQLMPGATRALERIRMATDQPLRLQDVDTLRKIAGAVAKSDGADAEFGRRIRNGIDDYIDRLKPTDIVAGNAKEGIKTLTDARELWKRSKKADLLEETLGKIDLNAAVTGSGANIDNVTRQAVRSLVVGKATRHLWSSEEKNALMQVAKGTVSGNTLRLLGKLAPTGVVSSALSAGIGGAIGGVPGAIAVPAAGYALKKGADAITARQFKVAMDMIRRGYPAPPRGSPIAAAYAQLVSQGAGQGAIAGGQPKEPLKITVTQPANWPQRSP